MSTLNKMDLFTATHNRDTGIKTAEIGASQIIENWPEFVYGKALEYCKQLGKGQTFQCEMFRWW